MPGDTIFILSDVFFNFGFILGKPFGQLRSNSIFKILGDPFEISGRPLRDFWEISGRSPPRFLGDFWEISGRSPPRFLGDFWEIPDFSTLLLIYIYFFKK